MKKNEIINNIIEIPKNFYNRGDISIYSLLEETGYFEIYNQINESNILEELIKHPEYIEYWLRWSENKRTDSGWYLIRNDKKKYIVGCLPEIEEYPQIEYSNPQEACAVFIKKEIERIRMS